MQIIDFFFYLFVLNFTSSDISIQDFISKSKVVFISFIRESINLFSYEHRTNANTNTILYNFAVNGILYGLLLYVGIVKFVINNIIKKKGGFVVVSVVIIVFVLFMNENLQNSAYIYIITMMGYRYSNEKTPREELPKKRSTLCTYYPLTR